MLVEPDVPAVDVAMPEDIGLPKPEHALPVAGPSGDIPDVIGLTPGDASSVAPRGTPVGATAGAGPMPSGDVMPSGDAPGDVPIPPTCAAVEPQPKKAAAITAIKKRLIAGLSSFGIGVGRLPRPTPQHKRPGAHDLT
jgi:hypothetical protein